MLEFLDVLIGFVVVILTFSLAVTALTQLWLSTINARGRHLRDGLATLLRQVYPLIATRHAREIAEAVLMHPLVALERSLFPSILERLCDRRFRDVWKDLRRPWALARCRMGTCIEREELIKLLTGLVASNEPATISEDAREHLAQAMGFWDEQEQKIRWEDATTALRDIRGAALRMEVTRPEVAAHERHTIAIVQHLGTDFVARINAWFDQTMDRTTARFVGHTRIVTLVLAILTATVMQLDAVQLFNRISVDSQLRATLVQQATAPELQPGAAPDTSFHGLRRLAASQLIVMPSWAGMGQLFSLREGAGAMVGRVAPPGMILTWVLLSFGAPFWFNVLRELVRLRPILAGKEQQQREERASSQPAAAGGRPAPSSPHGAAASGATDVDGDGQDTLSDERGDLTAVAAQG